MDQQDSQTTEPATRSSLFRGRTALRGTTLLVILSWTYLYNLLLKELSPAQSFFQLLDTISADFVGGSLFAVAIGLAIVLVFSITKLYTQIIANIYSFRIIEDLFLNDLREGNFRSFFSKILHFEDQPHPSTCCPQRISTLLFSFSFLYAMSWAYVILFSEALYFVNWSAGVSFTMNENTVLLVPTFALAIPFSARVMAYFRYPYAQDYADFMPAAVFVFLLVASCGWYFGGEQKFFLQQVFFPAENTENFKISFITNCAFLAFIPVFFEAGFWMLETNDPGDEAEEPTKASR